MSSCYLGILYEDQHLMAGIFVIVIDVSRIVLVFGRNYVMWEFFLTDVFLRQLWNGMEKTWQIFNNVVESHNLWSEKELWRNKLTPCDGLCLVLGKYFLSKASSGEIPDFLFFFFLSFLGWGRRPFEPPDFNFTMWVLFSWSLGKMRDAKEEKLIEEEVHKNIQFWGNEKISNTWSNTSLALP